MKPNFALNLSHDGIVLLHRASSGWHQMGEVALDAPDMAAELAELRKLATSVSTSGLATKLVIPNSQILYRSLPDPGEATRDAAIRAALDGATPYALDDLIWDSRVTNGQIQVAVIARETLEEAESFATEHRFNPVSFVALPEAETYAGEPFFGRAKSADALIGAGTKVEPDEAPIHILPKRNLPPPPVEPVIPEPITAPDTEAPREESVEESVPTLGTEGDDLSEAKPIEAGEFEAGAPVKDDEAPSAPEPETPGATPDQDVADPVAETPSSEEAPKTSPEDTTETSAFQSRRLTASETAEKPQTTPAPPRLSARPSRFSAVSDTGAADPKAGPKPLGPANQSVTQPATQDETDDSPKHPHVAVTSGALPVEELDETPKPKPAPRPGKSAPLPEPPPMPARVLATEPRAPEDAGKADKNASKATAQAAQATAKKAAKGALKSLSGLSTAAKLRREKARETPADATLAPKDLAKPAENLTAADITPMSDRAAGLDRAENTLDEAEALTVFGARRRSRTDRPPSRRLGLILTGVLVVALLIVGLIAGLLPEDEAQPDAPAQQTSALDQGNAPQEAPATDSETAPETVIADSSAPEIETDTPDETAPEGEPEDEPELTPELLEQAALPAPPGAQNETPEPDLDALNAQYAATGIWPLAPDNGTGETGEDDLNALYTASIDPRISSQDAGALPDPARHTAESAPRAARQPAPPGTRYDYDEDGFIRATPEGTVTPDGAVVYAGRPDVTPKPRPGSAVEEAVEAALAPAAVDENDPVRLALAAFQPKLRPESLVENTEKANLGGMTRAELGEFSPKLRPASAQELAEEEARTETQDAQPRTAPVVTVSLIPKSRPQNFEKLAAAARAAEAAAAEAGTTQTSAATQVTARVPASPLPQSDPANVARAATVKNAINLRRLNLMGVYGSSSDRRALVRLPSGRFAKVKIGDRLDGGRVQSIGSDNLTYVKNGRAHTLEIQG